MASKRVAVVVLFAHAMGYRPGSMMRPTPTRMSAVAAVDGMRVSERLQTECLDSLGRLAAAIGHAQIESIKEVAVLEVRETGLELQVLSCDEASCVSLLLPVQFPTRCFTDDDGFEQCVLDNVHALDETVAIEAVPEAAPPSSAKYVTHYEKPEMPSWWVEPLEAGLSQACGDIREILNGPDMREEVAAIARALRSADVRGARVEAVGPAGMVFLGPGCDALHLRFRRTCESAGELREAVLAAIAGDVEERAASVVDDDVVVEKLVGAYRGSSRTHRGLDDDDDDDEGALPEEATDLAKTVLGLTDDSPVTISRVEGGLEVRGSSEVATLLRFGEATPTPDGTGQLRAKRLQEADHHDPHAVVVDVKLPPSLDKLMPCTATLRREADALVCHVFARGADVVVTKKFSRLVDSPTGEGL